MRIKFCLLSALLAVVVMSAPVFSSEIKTKWAPYYSLNIGEAVSVPSVGDWFFALNLSNDIGVVFQPNDEHKFFGLYELKYTGPGLKKQEGEKFTDRYMDHIYVLKHNYKLNEEYTLKSQLDFMKELKRTGTNEVWGRGLYDFDRYGCGASLERKFNDEFKATADIRFHYINFPNYTDLLSEVQASSGTADISTGKQNQNIIELGVGANYKTYEAGLNLMFVSYTKQKIVTDTVQSDGSYYSGQLQRDTIIGFNAKDHIEVNNWLLVEPALGFNIKSSNQNYLYFSSATATVPAEYFGNYYSYNEFSFMLPANFKLSNKWDFYLSPELYYRYYLNRPPMDGDNNFIAGRHYTALALINWGFVLRSSEVSSTTFFFVNQAQTSSTKFEKYLPYNYNGFVFGVNFNFTY